MLDLNNLLPIADLVQGDYWNFSVLIPDYDATTMTCYYWFKMIGVIPFSIASVPNSDGSFLFTVPSITTATYTPGLYYLTVTMVDNATSERTTVCTTEIQIKPDLTLANTNDPRSANRIAFDNVEAALKSSVASGEAGLMEYTIGGTVVKTDKQGLKELRAHYLKLVRAEEGKRAIGNILYSL